MCGICGVIGNVDNIYLKRMLDVIVHRGPDHRGTYAKKTRNGKNVLLGHQRLSVIDLSEAGHNPMPNSTGIKWITYNGEIYNFRQLRKELEQRKYKFRSSTDTEVILAAHDEWGIDHLNKLNGMFAYALWDEHSETLFAARDHLGIKPFYYTETEDGFAFASEIKSLLQIPQVKRKAQLDLESLHKYLTFLWVPDPKTIFHGIYKLPPGHYLLWNEQGLKIHQYWDIKFQENEEKDLKYWESTLLQELTAAVERQLISDVPLGAFLSGGIDSSSIVGLMTRILGRGKIKTYTVGASAEDLEFDVNPDDVEYARIVGKLFNTNYKETILESKVIELLPKMIWHMDEPIADPAILTSYLICKAAKSELTVMLSGMGADEIFAGYPRHVGVMLAEYYNLIPSFISDFLVGLLPGAGPGHLRRISRNLKKLAKSAHLPFQERYLGYCTYFTDSEKQLIYSSELQQATQQFDAYDIHRSYLDRVSQLHPINQMLYLDLKTFLPCLNLTYSDKTSMAASVEMRVPFLDNKLVELSAQIPPKLKLKGTTRKYILKQSLQDLLPKKILHRKKAGFSAPIRSWLLKDLRPMVGDLLSPETIRNRGYFDTKQVQNLIDEYRTHKEDNALKIFQLLTFELWHQTFLD